MQTRTNESKRMKFPFERQTDGASAIYYIYLSEYSIFWLPVVFLLNQLRMPDAKQKSKKRKRDRKSECPLVKLPLSLYCGIILFSDFLSLFASVSLVFFHTPSLQLICWCTVMFSDLLASRLCKIYVPEAQLYPLQVLISVLLTSGDNCWPLNTENNCFTWSKCSLFISEWITTSSRYASLKQSSLITAFIILWEVVKASASLKGIISNASAPFSE